MRRRRTVRVGLGVAAIGIGLFATACFPSAPPTTGSLSVGPPLVTFPTTPPPYSPMPIVAVTVTNTGGHAIGSIAITGIDVYSVPSTTCSSLAPGHNCVADIQFCPTIPGTYADRLTVTGQDAVTGATVQASTMLTGVAT